MTKHIVIDAYQDTPKITGTDRLAFNFLRELQSIDSTNKYTILCSNEQYTQSIIKSKNFKIVKPPINFKNGTAHKIFNYAWRRGIVFKLWLQRPDTYLSFHNMRLPRFRVAKRMIASNLDLIPIILSDYYGTGRHSPAKQRKRYTQVSQTADKFISISDFSKQELIKTINVPAEKIEVLYLAADAAFSPSSHNSKLLNPVEGKYLFTIGGSEARKNVQTIIDAYKSLPTKLKNQYKLVIAGGQWRNRKLNDTDNKNIIELGYFEDELLPLLYRDATAFIFASTYEGFGFTILEAMASETPVINARGSSLDEVAGKATLDFDPENIKELTQTITKLLEDEKLQAKLIGLGRKQNNKFSWKKSGKQLHKILTEQ